MHERTDRLKVSVEEIHSVGLLWRLAVQQQSTAPQSGQCAAELYHASHLWYPPFYTSPMASSSLQHWTASPTKEGCHWQAGGENRQTIQPDILSPPLLRLTSRKPLWLDLQPADIKTRLRHNWKSAQVVSVVSTEPFPHGTGTLWCLHLVPCVVELVGSCIPIHAHAWIGSCTCMNRDAGSYQLSHTWDQVISWSHAPRGVNNQDVIKMSDGHRNVVIR